MRFRIRTLLLLVAIIAAAIGWYKNHREAELGVRIRIPTPVPLDEYYEIPESLLEIRSRRQVREHTLINADRFDEELQRLKSMFIFNPDLKEYRDLLTERRSELLKIARTHLNDRASFGNATMAAWILDQCDDPTGLAYIKKRLLAARPKDGGSLLSLRNRLLEDPAFVESLRGIKTDSIIYPTACRLLFQVGDEDQMVELQWEQARERDYHSRSALRWLLEHRPSKEVFKHALEFLSDPDRPDRYSSLTEAVLSFDTGENQEMNTLQRQIEKTVLLRIEAQRGKKTMNYDHSPERDWHLLTKFGTSISAKAFRDYRKLLSENRHEVGKRFYSACRALQRIGKVDDAKEMIRSRMMSSDILTADINSLAEQLLDRDEVVEIYLRRCRTSTDWLAMERLSFLFAGSHNQKVVDAILKATAKANGVEEYWETSALRLVRRIGTSRIRELWKTIPTAETASGVPHFYKSWVENGTSRTQLVDWINRQLKPKTPLTIAKVLASPRYADDYIWTDVNYSFLEEEDGKFRGVKSDHQFATMALIESGRGELELDERFPQSFIVETMKTFAQAASELHWTSHSFNSLDRTFHHGFVVNDRLYKFSIAEGGNGSDDRYSTAATAEILNAVAIRHGAKGRFFCYKTEWGTTLVAYLAPQLALEIETKFGMRPIEGFEFYFKN